MLKMGPTAVGLYAIGLIGVCSALPIQSVNTGDPNVILLGALIFLSFGGVIAGCVCCRRRKKGFELNHDMDRKEFRNESAVPDTSKTEYPIFRALSPEAQRHTPVATPPVSNSNENLIEDDFDNNNGPISPADLENIENNNAVDYIQNQNEVGINIEPSPYSINRNLVNSSSPNDDESERSQSPLPIPVSELEDVIVTSSNSCRDESVRPKHFYTSDAQLETVVVDKLVHEEAPALEVEEKLIVKVVQHSSLAAPQSRLDSKVQTLIDNIEPNDLEGKDAICGNGEILPSIYLDSNNGEKSKDCQEEKSDATTPDELLSIKSGSSGKSGEINSVEEALRALDCAIAGENSLNSGGDDEDDLIDEDFECNNTNFQNVIRQLLINDGMKRILPDLSDDQLNDNLSKISNLDGVRTEAELLVDSILNESRKIAEEKRKVNNETVVIQTCEVKDNVKVKFLDKENCNNKSEISTSSPATLTPCESMEDFFSFNHLEKTSTPCIQNKYTSQTSSIFALPSSAMPELGLRKKLIDDTDVLTSPLANKTFDKVTLSETITINEKTESPNTADGTFTFPKNEPAACNQTFEVNKTFDLQPVVVDDANREYTHPGDPCTSKQALERDSCYPSIVYDHEEVNSEDMTTVTPVNTPIELNYSNEMWNRLTKGAELNAGNENQGDPSSDDNGFGGSGWFLHPRTSNIHENETFDMDGEEEDDANLESTFEALRKHLAEVLPQPQGITGPAEYSDDEDDMPQNRTFDEYRSPLDAAVVGLLEGDPTPGTTVQNEMFINYKRVLTPILEESEEETCKTFVMNETKCLDSTSTGCVDTGEAIMGVSKALMASNDTLFNFEDTLGEREDVFSPRTPTRSETQLNVSGKSGKSTEENSVATLDSEKFDSNNSEGIEQEEMENKGRRSPPKTIDLPYPLEMMIDNDVCSPEQQKTFSEGTNSSNTDRVSSDMSGAADHDATFTTYTNEEKTCITVIVKEDERLSEISEPEWGSTTSHGGGYEMNSLTDVPSLDYNINSIEDDDKIDSNDGSSNSCDVTSKNTNPDPNITLQIAGESNQSTEDNQQEDSGNSTHMSADDRTSNSDHSLEDETQKCDDKMSRTIIVVDRHDDLMNQSQSSPSKNYTLHDMNLDDREKCRNFIQNEIAISSSQTLQQYETSNGTGYDDNLSIDDESGEGDGDFDFDSSKENKNPNINEQQQQTQQQLTLSPSSIDFDKQPISTISYQKVQTNSQDAVIVDKRSKLNSTPDHLYENKDLKNGGSGIHENIFYQPESTILPNKHQQTIANYSVSDVDMNGVHNEHCLMVADEIIAHLSGEEDPWAEPIHNDIHFTGPCSEIITSFTNEWDSDVDDSHSSEEFMYVRGTPTKEKLREMLDKQTDVGNKVNTDHDFFEYEGLNEADVWSTHEDKVPVADSAEDEISEGSSSEFEGEFVPSCWDSMATPARSALKSPDKSSSDLGDITDEKKLATYSNSTSGKWPQNFDSIDLTDGDVKTENLEDYGNNRPDSGVGESAEMLSDRLPLGELCHTKSTLRLPLKILPPTDSLTDIKPDSMKLDEPAAVDRLILPTPSCTGSMDSISSSSGSERQVSFSTFGKNQNSLSINIEVNDNKRPICNTISITNNEQVKPALILIENGPIEFPLGSDKIKQSDSTDEDSGIESIMKVNRESD
ncbi:uncharacterized protein LOC119653649 isoform X6 [Hermetia illucens]|uniref:uncharacterized protein LOC119653649 isoform X6 n=1 Tax=Hermetia illucens TaxID=343691 RepID=UPI0018CC685D|nr:uncharacterized protein LOC119653649 isoform X6 [Hermetia illucens]